MSAALVIFDGPVEHQTSIEIEAIKLLYENESNQSKSVICLLFQSFSSWIVDNYFNSMYSNQSSLVQQPISVIGAHDMFLIYKIVHYDYEKTLTPKVKLNGINNCDKQCFLNLCSQKLILPSSNTNHLLTLYNNYLKRAGLKDLIDLYLDTATNRSSILLSSNYCSYSNELDYLLLKQALEKYDKFKIIKLNEKIATISTKENIFSMINENVQEHENGQLSRFYIRHTILTYLSLLLDTRNEHALVHALFTPNRTNIDHQTIIDLKQLSNGKNLSIYQILLSFVRRKELLLLNLNKIKNEDENDRMMILLEKYYIGIKEFIDFIEQLQMIIDEGDSQNEPDMTFEQLITSLRKQLRRDPAFSRCDNILIENIKELCNKFPTTMTLMHYTSPVRSASAGGSLCGRKFLRSLSYLCAKETIAIPILFNNDKDNNDYYESPSTDIKKAMCYRLLRSPLTPLADTIISVIGKDETEKQTCIIVEDKSNVESVFLWNHSHTSSDTINQNIKEQITTIKKDNRFVKRRKSQRCLDLSTIYETSFDLSLSNIETTSTSTTITIATISKETITTTDDNSRQPLKELDLNTFDLSSDHMKLIDTKIVANEKENFYKRSHEEVYPTNPSKKQKTIKKALTKKPIPSGQKLIKNYFSKT